MIYKLDRGICQRLEKFFDYWVWWLIRQGNWRDRRGRRKKSKNIWENPVANLNQVEIKVGPSQFRSTASPVRRVPATGVVDGLNSKKDYKEEMN